MQTLRQISRFGFVGIIATAVHVGVGLGLHEGADMRPLWANLIAFGCALGVSFFGQTRLTFPDSSADGGAFVRFAVVAVSGLGLNQLIVGVVASVLASPYRLALLVLSVTVPRIPLQLPHSTALKR